MEGPAGRAEIQRQGRNNSRDSGRPISPGGAEESQECRLL